MANKEHAQSIIEAIESLVRLLPEGASIRIEVERHAVFDWWHDFAELVLSGKYNESARRGIDVQIIPLEKAPVKDAL